MKKIFVLFILSFMLFIVSCNKDKGNEQGGSNPVDNPDVVALQFDSEAITTVELQSDAKQQLSTKYNESIAVEQEGIDNDERLVLLIIYEACKVKMDKISGTTNEVKTKLNELYVYYQNTVVTFKQEVTDVKALKLKALKELEAVHSALMVKVNDVTKDYLQAVYNKLVKEVNDKVNFSQEDLTNMIKSYAEEATKYYQNIVSVSLGALIQTVKDQINVYVEPAIKKIKNSTLKAQVVALKEEAIIAISKVTTLQEYVANKDAIVADFKAAVLEIASEYLSYSLDEYKAMAKDLITTATNELKNYINNTTIQGYITTFVNAENQAIDAINKLADAKTYYEELPDRLTAFAEEKGSEFVTMVKNVVIDEVNTLVTKAKSIIATNEIVQKVEALKSELTTQLALISEYRTVVDDVDTVLKALKAKAEEYIAEEFVNVKTIVLDEIKELVDTAKTYYNNNDFVNALTSVYNKYDKLVRDANDLEEFKKNLTDMKDDVKDDIATLVSQAFTGVKNELLAKLTDEYNKYSQTIKDNDVLTELNTLFNNAKTTVNNAQNVQDLVDNYETYISDLKTALANVITAKLDDLIEAAQTELNTLIDTLKLSVTDETLTTELTNLQTSVNTAFDEVVDYTTAKDAIKNIADQIKTSITNIASSQLVKYKDVLLEQLAKLTTEAKALYDGKNYQNSVEQVLTTYTSLINAVTDLATFKAGMEQMKNNIVSDLGECAEAIFADLKNQLLDKCSDVRDAVVTKVKSQTVKNQIDAVYDACLEEINKITDAKDLVENYQKYLTDLKDDIVEIASNAAKAVKDEILGYVDTLTTTDNLTPYSMIPETMRPGYAANLVNASSLVTDYTNFVNVSSIKYGGFGEQWQMVCNALDKCQTFLNIFNYAENGLALATEACKAYYSATTTYDQDCVIDNDHFSLSVVLMNGILTYEVQVKDNTEVDGEQETKPSIVMSFDTVNNTKDITITVSDSMKLRYYISSSKYEIGIKAAVASYYLLMEENEGNIEGHVFEKLVLSTSADFYITNQYVSAVGNKASGMVASQNFINELYDVTTGKLLTYDVYENNGIVEFHTLWFNLSDVTGFTNIKVDSNKIYVNNSTKVFAVAKNTNLSRKFDIEMRTQYFYSKDNDGNIVKNEVQLPMLFVQEVNFNDYSANVASKNTGLTSTITLNSAYITKVKDDQANLIPTYKNINKSVYTEDKLNEYLGIEE